LKHRLSVAACFALLSFCGSPELAIAQTSPTLAEQNDNQPWERLPDGRVVIEIKGVKLAFAPELDRDAKHASVNFVAVRPPEAQLTFRQVVNDPAPGETGFFRVARGYDQDME
jgi:hypothetical protein